MKLKVIACRVAFREICHAAARCPNWLDLEFLDYDLHDDPTKGAPRLQEAVDAVPEGDYDAILVGFGLCEKLLLGLAARHTQLVVPRAHDCLTFFLGSKERYAEVFFDDPRTYYYTAGWVEKNDSSPAGLVTQGGNGQAPTYGHYVEKYGEDTARALMEMMEGWKQQYHRGLYIAFDFADGLPCREKVQAICRDNGWDYAEVPGDLSLLQRWLDGDWDTDAFLTVPPGRRVAATIDERVVTLAE